VESEAEVEKCAWNLDYYAENAESHLKTETRDSNATESYVQYTPMGVVLPLCPGTIRSGRSFALPPRP